MARCLSRLARVSALVWGVLAFALNLVQWIWLIGTDEDASIMWGSAATFFMTTLVLVTFIASGIHLGHATRLVFGVLMFAGIVAQMYVMRRVDAFMLATGILLIVLFGGVIHGTAVAAHPDEVNIIDRDNDQFRLKDQRHKAKKAKRRKAKKNGVIAPTESKSERRTTEELRGRKKQIEHAPIGWIGTRFDAGTHSALYPRGSDKEEQFQWSRFMPQQRRWTWPIFVGFALFMINFVFLVVETLGEQRFHLHQSNPGYFTRAHVLENNADVPLQPVFDELARRSYNQRERVLVVIDDGLRAHEFRTNPAWLDLLHNSTFSPNLVHGHSVVDIPSFSLPNWVTIMTGAAPEVTGVMGNWMVEDILYDTIFSRTQQSDSAPTHELIRAFLDHVQQTGDPTFFDAVLNRTELCTIVPGNSAAPPCIPFLRTTVGTPYLSDLVRETLPIIGGNLKTQTSRGRLSLAEFEQLLEDAGLATNATTEHVRDALRCLLLEKAAIDDLQNVLHTAQIIGQQSPPLRLVVTTLALVDNVGHESGAHSRYRDASGYHAFLVRTLLHAVRRADQALGMRTSVYVVADHGHALAGGHGGSAENVRRGAFMIYHPSLSEAHQTFASSSFPAAAECDAGGPPALRGAKLGDAAHCTDHLFPRAFSLRQIAATIAASLRFPTPRQAQGTWLTSMIPVLWSSASSGDPSREDMCVQFVDHFQQRYTFMDMFTRDLLTGYQRDNWSNYQSLHVLYAASRLLSDNADGTLNATHVANQLCYANRTAPLEPWTRAALDDWLALDPVHATYARPTLQQYRDAIILMSQLYTDWRGTGHILMLVRNVVVSVILVMAFSSFVMSRASTWSLLSFPAVMTGSELWRLVACSCCSCCFSADRRHRRQARKRPRSRAADSLDADDTDPLITRVFHQVAVDSDVATIPSAETKSERAPDREKVVTAILAGATDPELQRAAIEIWGVKRAALIASRIQHMMSQKYDFTPDMLDDRDRDALDVYRHRPIRITGSQKQDMAQTRRFNRRVMFFGAAFFALYSAVNLVVYFAVYAALGFDLHEMDATLLSPPTAAVYLTIALAPGSILVFFFVRFTHYPWFLSAHDAHHRRNGWLCFRRSPISAVTEWLFIDYFVGTGHVSSYGVLMLWKSYFLLGTFMCITKFTIFLGFVDFFLPTVFKIPYLSPLSWAYRFDVLTIHLMFMPLVIGASWTWWWTPTYVNTRSRNIDHSRHRHRLKLEAEQELQEFKRATHGEDVEQQRPKTNDIEFIATLYRGKYLFHKLHKRGAHAQT